MSSTLVLHNFAISSASHRVRIALHLKDLPFEYVSVPIVREGAEELVRYRAMNPQAVVPTLVHGGVQIGQSLAILEYLEEIAPKPALLPADAAGRARGASRCSSCRRSSRSRTCAWFVTCRRRTGRTTRG